MASNNQLDSWANQEKDVYRREPGNLNDGLNVGGGEVLQYKSEKSEDNPWFDHNLIRQYDSMSAVKVSISVLLMAIFVLITLRIYRRNSIFKPKGLASELETITAMRQRDQFLLSARDFTKNVTAFFERTPLKTNKSKKDFIDYNLKRANITVIGGYRPMVMEEFYAFIDIAAIIICLVGVALGITVNKAVGFVIIVVTIWSAAVLPMVIVRSIVKAKNNTIKINFFDMYCKLHHSLMAGGATPVNKLLEIYSKTTDNPEMLRFVENCNNIIETYGEYKATTIIADEYREIAEVGKLMRLIKQQADGAEIQPELIGFREELIDQEKYRLSKIVDADIAKVKRSFILIMIMLAQAVLSAMSIYFPDMGAFSGIF